MPFNPARLGVARQRRLLNQKGFAALVGVTPHTVSRWEKGLTEPDEAAVEGFARALGFPVQFFVGPDLDIPNPQLVSFRSQTAMSAAVRDAALTAGAIGFQISDWVEDRFSLPKVTMPDLHLLEPEAAARALRSEWGLGEQPVSNMIHLVESHGVRVFSLAEDSRHVNAFSLWRDAKPFMFLNTMKSSENSRFDAAHELGHLVLHQDGNTIGRVAEDQANKFASAFLMPKADVLAHVTSVYSLAQLTRLKLRWKVSVAALNYRLHKVGITTDWRNRDLCIQISREGYSTSEPNGITRERSMVWQKLLRLLWVDRQTVKVIADDLHLPDGEVTALIFGITADDGAREPAQTPALRIVGS